MIIKCPSCGERVSSRASVCPHCKFDIAGDGQGLPIEEATKRTSRQGARSLEMWSYAGLFITMAGAVWYWLASDSFSRDPGFLPLAALVTGTVWYLLVRCLMVYRKFKRD